MNSILETANHEKDFAISSSSNCVVAILTISWQDKRLYVGEVNEYISELSSDEEMVPTDCNYIEPSTNQCEDDSNKKKWCSDANASDGSLEPEQSSNTINTKTSKPGGSLLPIRDKAITKVIVSQNLAFSFTEEKMFKRFAKIVDSRWTVPSRGKIKTIMITEDEWTAVADIINILKPFNDITNYISGSSYPTMSIIYPTMCMLRNTLLREFVNEDDSTYDANVNMFDYVEVLDEDEESVQVKSPAVTTDLGTILNHQDCLRSEYDKITSNENFGSSIWIVHVNNFH
ncbi:9215_t:CDS:2, partial [Racocetra fulgida]